jgi:iron complex outermembrane recepter protein
MQFLSELFRLLYNTMNNKKLNMEKRLLQIIFILFLFSVNVMGQNLYIKGKIVDTDKNTLSYATIGLKRDSTFITGMVTDSLGRFTIEKVKPGLYQLSVSYMGYKTVDRSIEIKRNIDLGDIFLTPASINIDNITVVGKIPKIRRQLDRFIVSLQNSPIIRGKNILMALRYAPGIIIERDGSIVLNGKTGAVIMVDGKKLNMTGQTLTMYLQNIRAESIDRIEVITNPDARYESEGQGGVIDIYFKKSTQQGINGSIYTTWDQARYSNYNIGESFNLKYKRLTMATVFGYDYDKKYSFEKESLNYLSTSDQQYSTQTNRHKDHSYSYRTGLQYELNKRNLIGIEVYGAHEHDSINSLSSVLVQPEAGEDSTTLMNSHTRYKNTTTTYSLNYIYTISEKSSLILLSDYTTIRQKSYKYYQYSSSISPQIDFLKKTDGDSGFHIITTQLDYNCLAGRIFKIITGGKFSWIYSKIDEGMKDCQNQSWISNPLYTFNYKTNEYLSAGYINTSWKTKKISGTVGIRGEYDQKRGSGITNNEFKIFPSVLLKYAPNDESYYSLSYRRRINRAPYRSLVPFYNFNSPYSITIGNPNLNSSIVDAYSISTGYRSYSLDISYDYIKNMIYPISTYDPATSITYIKNANTKAGHNINVTFTLPFTITKWWEMFNNIVFGYRYFKDEEYLINTNNKNLKVVCINNFSLPGNYNFEIDMTGMTPSMAGPMIRQRGGIMIDMAISKDFFKGKLGVSISGSDITGVLSNLKETAQYNGFKTVTHSDSNRRMFSLSLSYNFDTGKKFKAHANSTSQKEEKARTKDF